MSADRKVCADHIVSQGSIAKGGNRTFVASPAEGRTAGQSYQQARKVQLLIGKLEQKRSEA
jgi:hypothetical protein